MTTTAETSSTKHRIVYEVDLVPLVGDTFQPTGFPNIGPCEYSLDGRSDRRLLVESPQSMANRLEAVAWNGPEKRPHEVLRGLPWVRVLSKTDGHLTSSREEAHRLGSAYITGAKFKPQKGKEITGLKLIKDLLAGAVSGVGSAVALWDVAPLVAGLDPLSLLHGVFFAYSELPGQPRVRRAVSASITAYGVNPVRSGGVKLDHIEYSNEGGSNNAKEGRGPVPYARTEYTAERIVATFVIDVDQIRSYRLGGPANKRSEQSTELDPSPVETSAPAPKPENERSEQFTELLVKIAQWEIAGFLESGNVRLRTACDLQVLEVRNSPLPSFNDLGQEIQELIKSLNGGREYKDGEDPEIVCEGFANELVVERLGRKLPYICRWTRNSGSSTSTSEQAEEAGSQGSSEAGDDAGLSESADQE